MFKGLRAIILIVCIMMGGIVSVSAASTSDFNKLTYISTFTDAGPNTVTVGGRGIFTVTDPSQSMAILFKDTVSVKNFKVTMKFNNAYGNIPQDGWYAINFSKTPNWFSSVSDNVKELGITGLNIIFKLDPTNKKLVYMEINYYNPTEGFKQINSFLDPKQYKAVYDLAADWACHCEIKNGILFIEGNQYIDLNQYINKVFPDDKAFVGFGGFSEPKFMKVVNFTLEYDAVPTKDAIAQYNNGNNSQGSVTSSNGSSSSAQPGASSVASSTATTSSAASASSLASSSLASSSESSTMSGSTSALSDQPVKVKQTDKVAITGDQIKAKAGLTFKGLQQALLVDSGYTLSLFDKNGKALNDNNTVLTNDMVLKVMMGNLEYQSYTIKTDSDKNNDGNMLWIFIAIGAVIFAGGAAVFFIIHKRKIR